MSTMDDNRHDGTVEESSGTLREQDIRVERTVGRRSFLAATGLTIGAAVLASGCTDPDRKRPPQPGTATAADPDKAKASSSAATPAAGAPPAAGGAAAPTTPASNAQTPQNPNDPDRQR